AILDHAPDEEAVAVRQPGVGAGEGRVDVADDATGRAVDGVGRPQLDLVGAKHQEGEPASVGRPDRRDDAGAGRQVDAAFLAAGQVDEAQALRGRGPGGAVVERIDAE